MIQLELRDMKLYNNLQPYLWITLFVLISTVLLWIPFLLKQTHWLGLTFEKQGFQTVLEQYDGAFYIIPAKTLYQVDKMDIPGVGFILSLPLSPGYFAAHLPLYPLLIRLFSILGYLHAMIFVNILFTILFASFFYYFLRYFKLTEKPLLLTFVMLMIPRFLIVRSTGAPESIFMLLVLASLLFFEKKNYLLAGIAGGLATATKTPGILLFVGFVLVLLERFIREKKFDWKSIGIIGIPLGLIAVFTLYYFQYHDFFAYFHTGGVVQMPYPFSAFNSQSRWVGTAWLEDILLYFFLYGLTVVTLFRSKLRSLFYFSLIFFIAIIFVQHRDISRYSLPLWPMACIAFEKFFTSKRFLLVLIFLLPAIYLFSWNFIAYNIMPISDWRPFF